MLAMAMTMVLTLRPESGLTLRCLHKMRQAKGNGTRPYRASPMASSMCAASKTQLLSRCGHTSRSHAYPSAATRGRGQAKRERSRFPKVERAAQVTTRYDTANALYHYTQHYYMIYNYMYALVYTI